jgi:hypothetical protein
MSASATEVAAVKAARDEQDQAAGATRCAGSSARTPAAAVSVVRPGGMGGASSESARLPFSLKRIV